VRDISKEEWVVWENEEHTFIGVFPKGDSDIHIAECKDGTISVGGASPLTDEDRANATAIVELPGLVGFIKKIYPLTKKTTSSVIA
jgi:hypothetical protein